MPHKRNIVSKGSRLAMDLKTIQYAYLCPLFANLFILPVIILLLYKKNGASYDTYNWILRLYQTFSPFLAMWCPLMYSNEFIEGDGHEVLYLNKKIKIGTFFSFFILNILVLICPFAAFSYIFPGMLLEYIRLVIDCFFYCGACYFIVYLTRSVSMTCMVFIIYTLFATYGKLGEKLFLIYYNTEQVNKHIILSLSLPLALFSCLCWLAGVLVNRKVERIC